MPSATVRNLFMLSLDGIHESTIDAILATVDDNLIILLNVTPIILTILTILT